jgi:ATP-dependent Clp protease ATP-binding subunit ClpA
MHLTVPIYVEGNKPGGGQTVYRARPLFFNEPLVQGDQLDRLLGRLTRELGQRLTTLGREDRHDALAAYTFYPTLRQQRLDLTLLLRRRTARCRFLFVIFRQFGRRVAFTPSVPEVWFDLDRSETLRDRAIEVLTRHFREQERDDTDVNPEAHTLTGTAYVTPLEITIRPPAVPPRPAETRFLLLGDAGPVGGATELRRVGRCLDWQYPDDLDRVALREPQLDELTRLLDSADNRPILLIGPRQVGKTALIHEYVFRQVSQRATPFRDESNVWLLAPARLISGMSYVGQWENRLLAILKVARRRRHVLYFDDLLGLFHAGQTGSSTLSVAGVLKPYLERREVRVVGEITPEAFRVLRERDRGFADLFHLLPVTEPSEPETLRILISVQRQLEAQQRCRFDLEVLPTVLDLQRRYARGIAFPGKAAAFLRQLAVKFRGAAVTRWAALAEFHVRSGLAVTFLDRQTRLDRQDVLESLSKQVIGQEAALHAAADVIAIAKARLNDPDRPLAAFLFLGPTGVGKTQCAKAIAAYLFGSEERLVRFDLNEYSEPGSAARLVGTFDQPEGLLTSVIRRQPFAVVLFDEVEKAHPEVFDLLLQVLGEGRLTDALGRTVDFTNALIVLTSNLGVREAEGHLGYRQDEAAAEAGFVRAAERFFRPEFFNRLDRVLPFRRLTRDHVRDIARKLIGDVFGREGLVQRKCVLSVESPAMERIVDQGYDPLLGARALKRAIERQLTQPIAVQLAALPPGGFTAVRVYPGPEQLAVHVQSLEQVVPLDQPAVLVDDPAELLRRVRAALRRIEDELAPLRPAGPVTLGQVRPEQYHYFIFREQSERVRDTAKRLAEEVEAAQVAQRVSPTYRQPDAARLHPYKVLRNWSSRHDRPVLREMAAALDINEYVRDLAASAEATGTGPYAGRLLALVWEAALLQTLADSIQTPTAGRLVLWPHGLNPERQTAVQRLLADYRTALPHLHLEVTDWPAPGKSATEQPRFLIVQGLHALPLLRLEAGTHLFCPKRGVVEPVLVDVLPLAEGADAAAAVSDRLAQRQVWLEALTQGRAAVGEDPFRPGPVLRIYEQRIEGLDLRTGMTVAEGGLIANLLSVLPLPPEIVAGDEARV